MRRRLRNLPIALCLLIAVTGVGLLFSSSSASPARTTTQTVDGRQVILHVSGGSARPLVIMLHGWELDAENAESQTGFSAYADAHGFDVAYPQSAGKTGSWNAGGCCGGVTTDDVGFLEDLARVLHAQTGSTATYLAGFSNGGMLALLAACRSTLFTAAASVAGPLLKPCGRSVPLLQLHGDSDTTVPLKGGYSRFTKTHFPSSVQAGVELRVFHGGHTWPAGATAEVWEWLRSAGSSPTAPAAG